MQGKTTWDNQIKGIRLHGNEYFDHIDYTTTMSAPAWVTTGTQCIQGPDDAINFLRQALLDAIPAELTSSSSFPLQDYFKCD